MTTTTGLINLVRWLAELRKTVSLCLAFITKGYDKGHRQGARWLRRTGQAREEGRVLAGCHSPHAPTCPPSWKVPEPPAIKALSRLPHEDAIHR